MVPTKCYLTVAEPLEQQYISLTQTMGKGLSQSPSIPYLSNLSKDIKRNVTPHHSGGLSTSTGLYAQLWLAATNTLLPSSISRIWTDTRIRVPGTKRHYWLSKPAGGSCTRTNEPFVTGEPKITSVPHAAQSQIPLATSLEVAKKPHAKP